jgi:hypothetical protein
VHKLPDAIAEEVGGAKANEGGWIRATFLAQVGGVAWLPADGTARRLGGSEPVGAVAAEERSVTPAHRATRGVKQVNGEPARFVEDGGHCHVSMTLWFQSIAYDASTVIDECSAEMPFRMTPA